MAPDPPELPLLPELLWLELRRRWRSSLSQAGGRPRRGALRGLPFNAKQRAKYYRLTSAGRKQLASEQSRWDRLVEAVTRVMRPA